MRYFGQVAQRVHVTYTQLIRVPHLLTSNLESVHTRLMASSIESLIEVPVVIL